MQKSYEESYLGQLRKLIGRQKVLIAAERAVVRDLQGRVLFIRRKLFPLEALPETLPHYLETLADLQQFEQDGKSILK